MILIINQAKELFIFQWKQSYIISSCQSQCVGFSGSSFSPEYPLGFYWITQLLRRTLDTQSPRDGKPFQLMKLYILRLYIFNLGKWKHKYSFKQKMFLDFEIESLHQASMQWNTLSAVILLPNHLFPSSISQMSSTHFHLGVSQVQYIQIQPLPYS